MDPGFFVAIGFLEPHRACATVNTCFISADLHISLSDARFNVETLPYTRQSDAFWNMLTFFTSLMALKPRSCAHHSTNTQVNGHQSRAQSSQHLDLVSSYAGYRFMQADISAAGFLLSLARAHEHTRNHTRMHRTHPPSGRPRRTFSKV